jgi:hypothetical protein
VHGACAFVIFRGIDPWHAEIHMPSTPSVSLAAHPAASPERLVVKPREARQLLAMGNTYLYELIGAGELDSFLDGRSRKITVESIRRYIVRRLASTDNSVSTKAQLRSRGPRKAARLELSAAQEGADG